MNKLLFAFVGALLLTSTKMTAQFSTAASDAYQRSKDALNNSSFSLQNTYAKNVFEDINPGGGRSFHGIRNDGGYYGTLTYADKRWCRGSFDSNWEKQGQCEVVYPDGSWYFGYFKNGVEHGEGSIYADGEYYDLVFDNGRIISATKVTKPKFDKEELDDARLRAVQESIRQQQEFEVTTTSSSYSSSSSRRSINTSRIQRQADVTAKAYEEYKKHPNSSSHGAYLSNKKFLKAMQGR